MMAIVLTAVGISPEHAAIILAVAHDQFKAMSADDIRALGKNDCAGGPAPFNPSWKFPSWKVFTENWSNPY